MKKSKIFIFVFVKVFRKSYKGTIAVAMSEDIENFKQKESERYERI